MRAATSTLSADEPGERREYVRVPQSMLLGAVEAYGIDQVKVPFRARHRDVEKAPLFLDLLDVFGSHVRGDAPVNHIQYKHCAPLLALGRMDRRQNEIIFVQVGRFGFCACGLGWVER
jgi:hypothetical protein